jgi:2-polyprenyl-3-methyl-5-hydroxy-6-metoxy-1,4-benzoquinol methylase
VDDWIAQQADTEASSWETSIARFYPQHADVWTDPAKQVHAVTHEWNFLDALEFVPWPALIRGRELRVLDLAAGTGWLSAYLSRFDEIATIDALDSSRSNLEVMLPGVVGRMGGVVSKIHPIRALFAPLLVADGSYDLIVASSALHHAPRMADVLEECHRVIKPNGAMVLLNETPLETARYLYKMARVGLGITVQSIRGNYVAWSPSIASSGILYDPYLGDVAYSFNQWRSVFAQTKWSYRIIRTGLSSYKRPSPRPAHLTHFVLRTQA